MRLKSSVRAVLLACGLAMVLVPSSASAAGPRLLVGVGDNSDTMFSDPYFKALPIKIARYGVPWNAAVTQDHTQLDMARQWLQAAAADRVQPMIAFGAPAGRAGNYIPKVKQYAAAVKAFVRDFPQVKVYTPWNEPDFIYRSLARKPSLAAAYFDVLTRACRRCTVVAADVYLAPRDGLAKWLAAYKKALHHRPKAWGLHPYLDVRTHTAAQLRTLERYAGRAQIWLDEISGVLRRGHWPYPNQSATAANRDERFIFTLAKKFHNITRIYHYEWQGFTTDHWDSGLIGPDGKPRPAYYTFANAVRGKLP